MKIAEKENATLKKYINRLGSNWHELPEDNHSRVQMQNVVRSIEWGEPRMEHAEIQAWTKGELLYIESAMGTKTIEEIARVLNRPALSVKGQVAKVKVKIRNRERGKRND